MSLQPVALAASRPHPLDARYKYLSITVSESHPHIVIVALDRPRKRNAMNAALWREIGDAFGRQLGRGGDGCRCVIITGSGPCFTAGLDVSDTNFFPNTATKDGSTTTDVAHMGMTFLPKILEMQECLTAIETCPVPVIAAIYGPCIGAGVDLICCCDIRLCDESAVFCVKEAQLGLAADVGTLQRLPRIVGYDSRARELCYTAMPFSPKEALSIGLVSRVVAEGTVMESSLKIGAMIAAHSPVAIRGTKKSLVYSRDHTVTDGLHHVASHNAMALLTNDLPVAFKGMAMSKGKENVTPPKFDDLPPYSRL